VTKRSRWWPRWRVRLERAAGRFAPTWYAFRRPGRYRREVERYGAEVRRLREAAARERAAEWHRWWVASIKANRG
jgi:hypothetical protein